ncbi:DUF2461 domain-containing protein [Nonomuraea endophytica]|uniref:DUF2461 domain-containing protein n=1 Tax=Nonomuraea endophytica TaxID=714136 RepID=UPI0037C896D3
MPLTAKAFDFYKQLEADNTKEFWHAHKDVYERAVREPLEELLEGLEDEFGPAKLFRPQRDTRFSTDKSPYKTSQGVTVAAAGHTGYYLMLGADGIHVGGGFHAFGTDDTRRYREAVDGEAGEELRTIVDRLEKKGFSLVGERVKTQPRGYSADHPRIDLLRYKSLGAEKRLPKSRTTGGQALGAVRDAWRDLRPLMEWLTGPRVPS